MNERPLISVVMPAFNSEAHIREAINSVINQTYRNIELLVADGGSRDNTQFIVTELSRQDSRVKFIHNVGDQGPAHARSTAIRCARGEFVAFLDADDLWLEDKLEVQFSHVLETGAVFSFSQYREMSSDGSCVGPLVPMYDSYGYVGALCRRGIGTLTVLIKRSLFTDDVLNVWRRAGGEEYIWWLLILRKGVHAKCCKFDLARYRDTEGSLSKNQVYTLKSVWNMYKKVLGLGTLPALVCYLSYFLDSAIRKVYLRCSGKESAVA